MLIIKVTRKSDQQCLAHTGVSQDSLAAKVNDLVTQFSMKDHKIEITEQ